MESIQNVVVDVLSFRVPVTRQIGWPGAKKNHAGSCAVKKVWGTLGRAENDSCGGVI
jgi:hypothetical protein